uniref:LysR family transcriptional regulator n=1 Tax=Muribaculaceae bacterium Z82 TaxID=2304548 RepID=A0A7C9NU34_9BACT
MNEHQLRCFVTAAGYLNFTRAGQDLFMTQAAVTYQVNELEKTLGTLLFSRQKGKLALTDAGAVFLERAQELLFQMDAAKTAAHQAACNEEGSLSLATFGDVVLPLLPRVLSRFRERMPLVHVSLRQSLAHEIVSGIYQGDIDVGFVTGYGGYVESHDWLRSIPVMMDDHVAVMTSDHPLASCSKVSFGDLAGFPQVLLSEKDLLEREPSQEYVNERRVLLQDPQSVEVMVRAGYGLCVCVSHAPIAHRDDLVTVPIEGSPMPIWACCKKAPATPALEAFLDVLDEELSAAE